MPQSQYVVGTKAKAFIDGVELISGTISFTQKGGAVSYKTFQGNMGGAAVPDETVSISTPKFSVSPLDVMNVAQRLTGASGLLTIQDIQNGDVYTCRVMLDGKSTRFDPSRAAECTWDMIVLGDSIQA